MSRKKEIIKKTITESYFIKKFKDSIPLIIISLILSVICTMITYPGITFSDSYFRIDNAEIFANNIKKSIKYGIPLKPSNWWLTSIPSIMMAISKLFIDNIAFYTFIQSFIYFLLTFLLIKKLTKKHRILQYIFFMLNPLIFGVSTYYETGIGCISGIVLIILLISSNKAIKIKIDLIFQNVLLVFASFITFGYRANAFTIIPILILYISLFNCEKLLKFFCIISIVIGYVLTVLVPQMFKINVLSSKAAGFVWEMLEVIKTMDSKTQLEYIDYFDDIIGAGMTEKIISRSDMESVNSFIWEDDIYKFIGDKKNNQVIIKKYINLFIKSPITFAKVKWKFIKLSLGISKPLEFIEYDYNNSNKMELYKFNDCWQRHLFMNLYIEANKKFYVFTRIPIISFLISSILVFLQYLNKHDNRELYLFILLISIFYYAAFLINTQSFEIRYFYPSLYLLLIIDTSMIFEIIPFYINKIKNLRRQKICEYS